MSNHKINILTIEEKVAVIKKKEENPKLGERKLALEFDVSKTQINNILKNKTKILQEYEEFKNKNRKRLKFSSKYEDVNDLMYEWFAKARSKGIPISGPILQTKALFFADAIGDQSFTASNGWLEKFRRRHNICFNVLSGEGRDVDVGVVGDWKERLSSLCKNYSSEDIYNMDETGLFWRALPRKSLTVQGEVCVGGKQAKERLTVMLCCNSTGTDKLPLLVIGKSLNPRAFKGWKPENLPLNYNANTKAWMTASIFENWLISWNKALKRSNRKIILFLDNVSSHSKINVSNIKLAFFLPNTTSHTQPLDQGIIKTWKGYYRNRILEQVLGYMDEDLLNDEISKMMTIKDACIWAANSWKLIKPSTVRNCFTKAGFGNEDSEIQVIDESFQNDYDCDFEKFVSFDDDLPTTKVVEDNFEERIIGQIKNLADVQNNSEESESEIEVEEEEPVTWADVTTSLQKIKKFHFETDSNEIHNRIEKLNACLNKYALDSRRKRKQTLMTDYLKK